MNLARIIFSVLLLPLLLHAQAEQPVTIVGDSLIGKIVGGEKIREVIGHVKISKEDVVITSDIAVQHIATGNIELKGNVVFTQGTKKLFTEKAFYESKNNFLRIDTNFLAVMDGDSLEGGKGSYSKSSDVVTLTEGAVLNRKGKKIKAQKLIYFRSDDKISAVGDVEVVDSASALHSDSLIYFSESKLTLAFKNVRVENLKENFEVYGNVLRDSGKVKVTEITGTPLLVKIDSTLSNGRDTLFVLSEKMKLLNDTDKVLIASGNVKILRNNLSLSADSSLFDIKTNGFTAIKNREFGPPVKLWFKENQVSGDSVFVSLKENELKEVNIKKDALLVSIVDSTHYRYNQISGSDIKMSFKKGKLNSIFVNGNVLSIYYLTDNGKRNGLIKSSARSTIIELDSNSVAKVKLYGTPNSEYHPENLIEGNESEFVLPAFRLFHDRPKREEFIRMKLRRKLNYPKIF